MGNFEGENLESSKRDKMGGGGVKNGRCCFHRMFIRLTRKVEGRRIYKKFDHKSYDRLWGDELTQKADILIKFARFEFGRRLIGLIW